VAAVGALVNVVAHVAAAPWDAAEEPGDASEETADEHDPEEDAVRSVVLAHVGHDFLVALRAGDFLGTGALSFHNRSLLLSVLHDDNLRLLVTVAHRLHRLHTVAHLHLLLLHHLLVLHLHVIHLHLLVLGLKCCDFSFFTSDLRSTSLSI